MHIKNKNTSERKPKKCKTPSPEPPIYDVFMYIYDKCKNYYRNHHTGIDKIDIEKIKISLLSKIIHTI